MSGAVSASTQIEEDVVYGYKDGMALIYHVLNSREQEQRSSVVHPQWWLVFPKN